jgi:hypothetical protein
MDRNESQEELTYVEFVTYLVNKQLADNNWLVDKLAEFSKEID